MTATGPARRDATDRPVLFFLHGLGCSARSWRHVIADLGDGVDAVALDLPGHGLAAGSAALTVDQMADFVSARIRDRRPRQWAIVGHSMGGKIGLIVASRAERGMSGVPAPLAVVLVAPSPLSPEPMDETTRQQMITWCADGSVSEANARTFVHANISGDLEPDRMAAAVADVEHVDCTAWVAWLERGSLEDWSDAVATVHTPTLIIAGAEDGDLGIDAQRSLTVPHLATVDVAVVQRAAHLIMLEQPAVLAKLIVEHVRDILVPLQQLAPDFAQLIMSERVSARTRQALLTRLSSRSSTATVFDDAQRSVLEAVIGRVVPQRHTSVDLVTPIEAMLASRSGDGWRFAELPDDVEAWRRGLTTLAARCSGFVDLRPDDQDDWIRRMIDGDVGTDLEGHLTGKQMALWFEDVCAAAIRTWISHPAAMDYIGYDGFANGGDGPRKSGYLRVSAGVQETWQRGPALIEQKPSSA